MNFFKQNVIIKVQRVAMYWCKSSCIATFLILGGLK